MEDMKVMGMLMGQLMRAKQNRMSQLMQGLELHPAQAPILFTLMANDGLTQRELGEKLGLRPATITIMLNRMQRAALVERKGDKEDLRLSRVFVTDRGKAMSDAARAAMAQVQQEACEGFTAEELMLMRRLLIHMKSNLDKAAMGHTKKVRH